MIELSVQQRHYLYHIYDTACLYAWLYSRNKTYLLSYHQKGYNTIILSCHKEGHSDWLKVQPTIRQYVLQQQYIGYSVSVKDGSQMHSS